MTVPRKGRKGESLLRHAIMYTSTPKLYSIHRYSKKILYTMLYYLCWSVGCGILRLGMLLLGS
jgi:hypothetical protein